MDLSSGQRIVMDALEYPNTQTTKQIVARLELQSGRQNIWTTSKVGAILRRLEKRDIVERLKQGPAQRVPYKPARWRRTRSADEVYRKQF